MSPEDIHHMRHALALARRALGRAAPNPAVGCVIVRDGIVAGRGWTGDKGRPHAEVRALEQAGAQARGATAYVTLEPCAHYGQTPPCAEALVKAGIARAVIACGDPDSRVNGRGIESLRSARIVVATGVLEKQAQALNRGFILRSTENRPLVTLKTAVSADGKIAPAAGKRAWITGARARLRTHLERSFHDALLVGIGTALADDPQLTTRLPGYEHQIMRVVLDSALRLTAKSRLVLTAAQDDPVLIIHNAKREGGSSALPPPERGVERIEADTRDLKAVLAVLAERGITRLLVEGGAKIHTAFLEAGYADFMLVFKASEKIGRQGVNALEGYDIADLETNFGMRKELTHRCGEDSLEFYAKPA